MIRYVIISPVRNEAADLPGAVTSVASQTILPTQWIIVDDGSTDGTGKILQQAASKYPWITVVTRADRGSRKPGGGVVEAFYDGYSKIAKPDWEFIVKLDGDVSFEADYFQRCFDNFATEPKLGIAGGTVCNVIDGTIKPEAMADPAFHVRGATKIYRRQCWDVIGDLIRAPGWDTLDELKAKMLGWKTITFKDIRLIHHRLAGSKDGTWSNWVKNGRANYIVGYHPVFMVFKAFTRLYGPMGSAGLALLVGFFSGYLKGVPQIADKDLIRYLRNQQIRRLTLRSNIWDEKPSA
jgi:biofilm PGA synthesis N-glycosyltransferase PgaC